MAFLTSKVFFRHLILAIIIFLALVWISMRMLSVLTRHGSEQAIPDFTGKTLEEAREISEDQDFEFTVMDSIYDPDARKGSILIQDPLPGSMVKEGRNVYVTTVAWTPEKVRVPDLRDLTLRQALSNLHSSGLQPGKLSFIKSFDNAIQEQRYKGRSIKPGTEVSRGSSIDLVVGQNDEKQRFSVPDVIGKNRDEALLSVFMASFNVGREYFESGCDKKNGIVYRQNPAAGAQPFSSPGARINLWYSKHKNFDETESSDEHVFDSIK